MNLNIDHFDSSGGGVSCYSKEEIFCKNSPAHRSTVKSWLIRENMMEYRCAKCNNTGQWLDDLLSLHIDHINGINNDHRLDNLRFLCPNCHSQTPTYCGKKR